MSGRKKGPFPDGRFGAFGLSMNEMKKAIKIQLMIASHEKS